MLNKHFDFEDYTISQFSVNEELQESILSGLPSDFSDLEKAIYIYIKMCKLFTYDEEFYAVNQKGPLSEKHRLIDNLSNISLTNNKVVCYEFNAIYSYMLNKLKINYKCYCGSNDYKAEEAEGRWYGTDHTFLEFMCDKFLVKADAVTGILHGDIMQAKLNQPLDGLICQNKNEQTKQEFQNSMRKVYGYIAEREPKLTQNEPNEVESFEDIASQFKQLTDKIKPVNLTDKIDILIRKVNDTKMIGVDAYSYLLQLRKILFTKQEQAENVKISIIRNSNSNSATALSVISIIIPDETGEMKISRYLYSPGNELLPISKDDLQEKFDSGVMGYIEEKNPVIPGIRR